MKNKDLQISEIIERQDTIREACDNPLFVHYIKGYLSGRNCKNEHHNLLFGMADSFMERHEPIEETNNETSN